LIELAEVHIAEAQVVEEIGIHIYIFIKLYNLSLLEFGYQMLGKLIRESIRFISVVATNGKT
jgi:hypothetical protein